MQDKFIPDEWCDLLIDLTSSQLRASIAFFLCTHPNMRFSEGVLPCAEEYRVSDILKCLEEMAEAGIVEVYSQNGTTLYGLTEADPWRSLVITLSSLEPWRLRNSLKYCRWIPSDQEKDSLEGQVICG